MKKIQWLAMVLLGASVFCLPLSLHAQDTDDEGMLPFAGISLHRLNPTVPGQNTGTGFGSGVTLNATAACRGQIMLRTETLTDQSGVIQAQRSALVCVEAE